LKMGEFHGLCVSCGNGTGHTIVILRHDLPSRQRGGPWSSPAVPWRQNRTGDIFADLMLYIFLPW
jgi:hypothetical protein